MSTSCICRVCVQVQLNLVDIYDAHYERAFYDLSGILVAENDGLPRSICTECAEIFTKFTEFRERVIQNHYFLLEALEKKGKIENESEAVTVKILELNLKQENYDSESDALGTIHCTQLDSQNGIILCKTKKKKSRKKINSKNLSKKPRKIVELDPEKILIIQLTQEEQRRRLTLEAKSEAFLKKTYRCIKCCTGFNHERKLEAHIEKFHKENASYTCKICEKTLLNASSLAQHEARHNTLYRCRMCSKEFVEKEKAVHHYESVHEGVKKSVTCKLCGMSFRFRTTLNGHMRSKHQSGDRPTCDACGKTFITKDSLIDHLLIHSGEKPHSCSCGKRFRLKSQLRIHEQSHTDAKNFRCVECDVLFKTRLSYNTHMMLAKAHVDPKRLVKNQCSVCGSGFPTQWQLRHHEMGHAGAGYTCPTCGLLLASSNGLRKHVRAVHLKVAKSKNHVCHQCGKRFACNRILENHLRTHTGEKPFACAVPRCGATFAQRSTLQTHVKLVHLKVRRGRAANDSLKASTEMS